MFLQQPFKETLCCFTISSFREKHINNFSVPKAFASAKALASLMGWAPLMEQAFLINRSPGYRQVN